MVTNFTCILVKLIALIITEFMSPFVYFIGDFNANITTRVNKEMTSCGRDRLRFCDEENLIVCDHILLED